MALVFEGQPLSATAIACVLAASWSWATRKGQEVRGHDVATLRELATQAVQEALEPPKKDNDA